MKIKLILLGVLIPTLSNAEIQVSEARIGLLKNDVRGIVFHHHYERGWNGNLELLFPAFMGGFWDYIFNPQLHTGTSINGHGGTSHVYSGLTWKLNMGSFVLEPTFGFDVHNGPTKKSSKKQHALGSFILFRESLSFGYHFTPNFTGYVMIDHVSNARIFQPNPGITTTGFRLGYAF